MTGVQTCALPISISLGAGDTSTSTASINGSDGTADLLNYTQYTTSVVVDLSQNLASGLTTVSNIENITGGAVSDFLTGNSSGNILQGGPGSDVLTGLGGDDYYMFLMAGEQTRSSKCWTLEMIL